jgi:hypothetical protein
VRSSPASANCRASKWFCVDIDAPLVDELSEDSSDDWVRLLPRCAPAHHVRQTARTPDPGGQFLRRITDFVGLRYPSSDAVPKVAAVG